MQRALFGVAHLVVCATLATCPWQIQFEFGWDLSAFIHQFLGKVFCCNILKWFFLLAPSERHKYYVSGDHQDALIGSKGSALNTHAALIKSSLVRVYVSSMHREKQVVYLSFPGALMKRSMPHSFNLNPPLLHNEVTLFWGRFSPFM